MTDKIPKHKVPLEIILLKETFQEAGGKKVYPYAEPIGLITCQIFSGAGHKIKTKRNKLTRLLERKAQELGATYIFKVEYKPEDNPELVSGDAYKETY